MPILLVAQQPVRSRVFKFKVVELLLQVLILARCGTNFFHQGLLFFNQDLVFLSYRHVLIYGLRMVS